MGIGVDIEMITDDAVCTRISIKGIILQPCRSKGEGVLEGCYLMEMRPLVGQLVLADGVVELCMLVPKYIEGEMDD